jgi:hypothetical protein
LRRFCDPLECTTKHGNEQVRKQECADDGEKPKDGVGQPILAFEEVPVKVAEHG